MSSERTDLSALEDALGKATKGPWFAVADARANMDWNIHICLDTRGENRVAFMASDGSAIANAALIVGAVNSLPGLIAELREAREENERLKAALEKIAAGTGVYGMQAGEYKQIARAALKEPSDD